MTLLGVADPAIAPRVTADLLAQASASLARSRRAAAPAATAAAPRGGLELHRRPRARLRRGRAAAVPGRARRLDARRRRQARPGDLWHRGLRLGLPAADCVMVGDAFDRDVVPAKAAGLRAVWLRGRSRGPARTPRSRMRSSARCRNCPHCWGSMAESARFRSAILAAGEGARLRRRDHDAEGSRAGAWRGDDRARRAAAPRGRCRVHRRARAPARARRRGAARRCGPRRALPLRHDARLVPQPVRAAARAGRRAVPALPGGLGVRDRGARRVRSRGGRSPAPAPGSA